MKPATKARKMHPTIGPTSVCATTSIAPTHAIFTRWSRLKNEKWKTEDQQVNIYLRYYRSNGELFGDPIIDEQISRDWSSVRLWSGWGWPDPGNWQPDRYRVEIWLDNNQKIAESHFTIH